MQVDLSGQVGLVTGASIGMGRSIALAVARCGADVAFCYRTRTERANEVLAEIERMGRRGLAVQADVGGIEGVKRLFGEYGSAFGERKLAFDLVQVLF